MIIINLSFLITPHTINSLFNAVGKYDGLNLNHVLYFFNLLNSDVTRMVGMKKERK